MQEHIHDAEECIHNARALLALRARALAKFGEVDTVPVRENNPFKIEKKYKNIKKSIRVLRRKKKA